MTKILLFGAGKSATCLIQYLVRETAVRGWQLVVAESNLALARSKIGEAVHAQAVALQVEDEPQRETLIRDAGLVISLLPPALHFLVAGSCIRWKKDLLTASYLDDRIRALEPAIRENGLLFLCEMGLDPGIDHMSAMELIHRIGRGNGKIVSFRSHTGGLISPESDDNPWRYKISWNPRNVVLAGAAGATFLSGNKTITRTYADLFDRCEEVAIAGIGNLAWYPNRDSLSYIPLYGLDNMSTFIRTTLRYPAFCTAWKSIVAAGLTDDQGPLGASSNSKPSIPVPGSSPDIPADPDRRSPRDQPLTFAAWSAPILPFVDDANREQLTFLGLFDNTPVPATARTSADILQHLLETRLAMRPEDKDMIVMLHEITYELPSDAHSDTTAPRSASPPSSPSTQSPSPATTPAPPRTAEIQSRLIVHGDNHLQTAMAKTVGLPLGIAAILILEKKITIKGLHIPIIPAIYAPVLKELATQGIQFEETCKTID